MTESNVGYPIRAELTANVWRVLTEVGATVAKGDELIMLESMKMEIPVIATRAGTIVSIEAKPESVVNEGDVLVHIAEGG